MGIVTPYTSRLVSIPLMLKEDSQKRIISDFFFHFQLIASCKSAWSRIQYCKKQNKVGLINSEYIMYI